jgi:hypothetical protein
MGGNRNDRDTRSFDKEELAKLARASVDAVEPTQTQTDEISESRTATLSDPLTMALLAEVARNAQTQDFDPADLPKQEAEPLAHPNLKRR